MTLNYDEIMLELWHVWNMEIYYSPRRWCICFFQSCQDRPFWLYECYHILLWATHPTTSLGDLWKCWRYKEETWNKKPISMLQFSFIHIRELRYMVKFAELKGSRQLPFEDFVARLPSGSLNLWCSAVALHDSMKGATAAWVAWHWYHRSISKNWHLICKTIIYTVVI